MKQYFYYDLMMENRKYEQRGDSFHEKLEKASYIARKIMEEGVMKGLEPYFKIQAIPQALLYRLYASNALSIQQTIISILQKQQKIVSSPLKQDNQTKCNPRLCPLKATIISKTPKIRKKGSTSFQHNRHSLHRPEHTQKIQTNENGEYYMFEKKEKRQSIQKYDRRKLIKLSFNKNSNAVEFRRYQSELNSQSGDQTEKMLRQAKSHKIDYPTTEKFIREEKKQKRQKETYISTKKKVNYTTDWEGNLIAMEKIPNITNSHHIEVEVAVLNDQRMSHAHCESLNIQMQENNHDRKIRQLTSNETESFGSSIMKHMKAPRPLSINKSSSLSKLAKQAESSEKIDKNSKENSIGSSNFNRLKSIPSKISFRTFQQIRRQNRKDKIPSFCREMPDESIKKIEFMKKDKKHRNSLLNQSDLKLSDTRQSAKNFENITLSNVQAFQFLVKQGKGKKNVTIDPFFTKQL